jgi:hypothetical protein
MKENWLVAWVEYTTAIPTVAVGTWPTRDSATDSAGKAVGFGTMDWKTTNEYKDTLDSDT